MPINLEPVDVAVIGLGAAGGLAVLPLARAAVQDARPAARPIRLFSEREIAALAKDLAAKVAELERAAEAARADSAERERVVAKLEAAVDRLEREARQARNYAERLEDAFEHRAQPIELDHRRKPRQTREKEPVHG